MPKPAPIVDPVLAEMLKVTIDPVENVKADQAMALFLQTFRKAVPRSVASSRHLVEMECGHFKVTTARHSTSCPRCGEMIRAGYDYHAFRELGERDKFSWPGDPLKAIHESRDG